MQQARPISRCGRSNYGMQIMSYPDSKALLATFFGLVDTGLSTGLLGRYLFFSIHGV